MIGWASENLEPTTLEAFNSVIGNGDFNTVQLAVSGLKAQYENAEGYEGQMLTGKSPRSSRDVFRSQSEVVQAMSDQRYDRDPAYRQDVFDKFLIPSPSTSLHRHHNKKSTPVSKSRDRSRSPSKIELVPLKKMDKRKRSDGNTTKPQHVRIKIGEL